MLAEGDVVELPDVEGKRFLETGVVEGAKKSRRPTAHHGYEVGQSPASTSPLLTVLPDCTLVAGAKMGEASTSPPLLAVRAHLRAVLTSGEAGELGSRARCL